jgi:hypothetical protein
MAKQLRGKTPVVQESTRIKFLCFGRAGVGKTHLATQFPGVYYIDTEGGATQSQYRRQLIDAGALYMGLEDGAQDFQTVIDEVKTLATTEHDRKSLVVDSFSKLYNTYAATQETRVGSDYGKDKKEANKPARQLLYWMGKLDMNVILICHTKDSWKRSGAQLECVGTTFDGYDKLDFELDLCVEVLAGQTRTATVRKTRIESFPANLAFDWHIDEFRKRYPAMAGTPKPFLVAGPEDVSAINQLLACIKIDADWQDRIFAKAGVQSWDEMPKDKIQACVRHLTSLLPKAPEAPAVLNGRKKKEPEPAF